MTLAHRDEILRASPRWLQGTRIGKILYAIGLHLDVLSEAARLAVLRKMPGAEQGYDDGLFGVGRDRRVRRFRREGTESFRARARRWRQGHRVRGGPYEFLRGIYAAFFEIFTDYEQAWGEVDFGTAGNTLGAGTLVADHPTYVAGHYWFLQLMQESTASHTAPAGWDLLASQALASGVNHYVYGRVAVNTANTSITVAGGARSIARVYRFTAEVDPSAVTFVESADGNGTSVTGPALEGAAQRIAFIGYDSGGSVTPFGGWSEVAMGATAEVTAGSAAGGVGIGANISANSQPATSDATLSDTAIWGVLTFEVRPPDYAQLIYRTGRRYRLRVDGSITRDDLPDTVWDPQPPLDIMAPAFAQWTLVFHWPSAIDDDGVWDDPGTWDDGGVWDCGLPPADVADLREVPLEYNAAHAKGRVVLLPPPLQLEDVPATDWGDSDAIAAAGGILIEVV